MIPSFWLFWIQKLAIQIIKKVKHSSEATFAIKNIESHPSWSILLLLTWICLLKRSKICWLLMSWKDALETLRYMNIELQKTWIKKWYSVKVRFDLDHNSEYFLHQQMKTIQRARWCFEEEMDEMLQSLWQKMGW
jgi:ATP-dependent Lon protease